MPRAVQSTAAPSGPGDPAAAEDHGAVVEHGRLAGRGRPDRIVGLDEPATAAVRLGRAMPGRTVAGTGTPRWRIRTVARNAAPPARALGRHGGVPATNVPSSIANVCVSRSWRFASVIVFVSGSIRLT